MATGLAARHGGRARGSTGPPGIEGPSYDSSEDMLQAAGKLPDGYGLRTGDARALPFPDDSFDLVIAAYLLHLLPGTIAAGRRGYGTRPRARRPGAGRHLVAFPEAASASCSLPPRQPRGCTGTTRDESCEQPACAQRHRASGYVAIPRSSCAPMRVERHELRRAMY